MYAIDSKSLNGIIHSKFGMKLGVSQLIITVPHNAGKAISFV
jgi:hypothetical protein